MDSATHQALEALKHAVPITYTLEQLEDMAKDTPLALYALRLRIALKGIAHGGDRLKLQQIAIDALGGREV